MIVTRFPRGCSIKSSTSFSPTMSHASRKCFWKKVRASSGVESACSSSKGMKRVRVKEPSWN